MHKILHGAGESGRPLFRGEGTDIWLTLGPLPNGSTANITEMLRAGAYGVRTSFCYGTHEIQASDALRIRSASVAAAKECIIIADIQGEKIRLGDFPISKIDIKNGQRVMLSQAMAEFDKKRLIIPVNSQVFLQSLSKGDRLTIGDGSAVILVVKKDRSYVTCESVGDGELNPNRGIVLQSGAFQPASLTDKDRADIKFVAKSRLHDAIALSFVAHPKEVEEARAIIRGEGANIPIIAKIETMKGVENLDKICVVSDAIMVARGDLALFAPWTQLGILVKKIVRVSDFNSTPWVMATQIAEGLAHFSILLRAEICDLTQWVDRGASAVMLSHECAFGPKAVETITAVGAVIEEVRKSKRGES